MIDTQQARLLDWTELLTRDYGYCGPGAAYTFALLREAADRGELPPAPAPVGPLPPEPDPYRKTAQQLQRLLAPKRPPAPVQCPQPNGGALLCTLTAAETRLLEQAATEATRTPPRQSEWQRQVQAERASFSALIRTLLDTNRTETP
ncbi:hypothetical protein [Nocardia asiatica]|uniref:hypothetical protein n=1 Tax=Nocardia asiatica TaxID=209252 RepID=UPI002454F587|nr:hypothetical protein [Nocardia asiatica]